MFLRLLGYHKIMFLEDQPIAFSYQMHEVRDRYDLDLNVAYLVAYPREN